MKHYLILARESKHLPGLAFSEHWICNEVNHIIRIQFNKPLGVPFPKKKTGWRKVESVGIMHGATLDEIFDDTQGIGLIEYRVYEGTFLKKQIKYKLVENTTVQKRRSLL